MAASAINKHPLRWAMPRKYLNRTLPLGKIDLSNQGQSPILLLGHSKKREDSAHRSPPEHPSSDHAFQDSHKQKATQSPVEKMHLAPTEATPHLRDSRHIGLVRQTEAADVCGIFKSSGAR